jgi:hypothetical protein
MDDIKIKRLVWVAHIVMDIRIPKKVPNRKFHNTRSVRKQRTRWEDVIHRDALQIRLEETRWG